MTKKKAKFLRIGYTQYSKLGLRRKNKQKYRKAKGGENKQRLKMKGHLRNVSIGFRSEKKSRDLVRGLKPVMIRNISDLKKIKQGEIGIVIKMGDKKRLEIAEYAFKNTIKLQNLNAQKFIEKIESQRKIKEELKSEKDKKKKEREKKAAEKEKETAKEEGEKKIENSKDEKAKPSEVDNPKNNESLEEKK
jgi:large subunit ribosomal protein L32e